MLVIAWAVGLFTGVCLMAMVSVAKGEVEHEESRNEHSND